MDLTQIVAAVATNGVGVVAVAAVLWFAYYRETKTIPTLVQSFNGANQAALEAFAQANKEANSSFEARQANVIAAFTDVAKQERALCQLWHQEHMAKLEQVLTETKEHRHQLRDLINAAGLRRAADEQRRQPDERRQADK